MVAYFIVGGGTAAAAALVAILLWRRRGVELPLPEPERAKGVAAPHPKAGERPPSELRAPASGDSVQKAVPRLKLRRRPSIPSPAVRFEYTILSLNGDPVGEPEFMHRLLVAEDRSRRLTAAMRSLLERDALTLECVRREYPRGDKTKEAPIFALCRQIGNRAQLMAGPRERDVLALCRGAFRLRYAGPPSSDGSHLELLARAADTILRLRPGILVDHAASVIWPQAGWNSHRERNRDFSPRDHLKMEIATGLSGLKLSSRGMQKFGFPELVIEGLPHDMAGEAAASMNSIALDLIGTGTALEPGAVMAVSRVGGVVGFDFRPAEGNEGLPFGSLLLLGAVDGEKPTQLGLLEVLSRLRKGEERGIEAFPRERSDEIYRQAQAALPRLKRKYLNQEQRKDRIFLVRRHSEDLPTTTREAWLLVRAWSGSSLDVMPIANSESSAAAKSRRDASIEEDAILDWMIMTGGDVEDGAFALRIASADQDAPAG